MSMFLASLLACEYGKPDYLPPACDTRATELGTSQPAADSVYVQIKVCNGPVGFPTPNPEGLYLQDSSGGWIHIDSDLQYDDIGTDETVQAVIRSEGTMIVCTGAVAPAFEVVAGVYGKEVDHSDPWTKCDGYLSPETASELAAGTDSSSTGN